MTEASHVIGGSEEASLPDLVLKLKELKLEFFQAQEKCSSCKKELIQVKEDLRKCLDVNPMTIGTKQARFYDSEEGKRKLRSMSEGELFKFFAHPTKKPPGEAAYHLQQRFPAVPAFVIERAVSYNKGSFVGAYLMVEKWLGNGQPCTFNFKVCNSPGERVYRMKWPHECQRGFGKLPKGKEAVNDVPFPSFPMILELQHLYIIKEKMKQEPEP